MSKRIERIGIFIQRSLALMATLIVLVSCGAGLNESGSGSGNGGGHEGKFDNGNGSGNGGGHEGMQTPQSDPSQQKSETTRHYYDGSLCGDGSARTVVRAVFSGSALQSATMTKSACATTSIALDTQLVSFSAEGNLLYKGKVYIPLQ